MTEVSQRRNLLISLSLAAAIVAVYSPVCRWGFVSYDDPLYLTENPQVREGLTIRGLRWALTTPLDQWMPITWLVRLTEYQVFGLQAGWYHVVNVLLHIANAVLLFGIFNRMTGAPWRSALVAGLFAVHPLHVEAVVWVTGLKDVLSTCLGLLTIGAYGRYVEQTNIQFSKSSVQRPAPFVRGPSSRNYYSLTLLLFALALMSKPMLVTLPCVLLLLDYWPLGRTQWAKPATGQGTAMAIGQLLKEKLPFFALAAVSCVVTYATQRGLGAILSLETLPLRMRIANAALFYVQYIGKTIWPAGLTFFYPQPPRPPLGPGVAAGVGLLAVTAGVVWAARRTALVAGRPRGEPWLVTGWFWYLGTLVPVIGLVRVGGQAMADRYTYIPLVGLFIMLVWSVPEIAANRRMASALAWGAAAAVLVLCMMVSRMQVGYWKDAETLLQHALEVNQGNWLAHYNFGGYLRRSGRLEEAIGHYQEAARLRPDFAGAQNNLGSVLAETGRLPEAIGHWEEAVRLKPDYAEAHYNLGVGLAQSGRIPEAVSQWNLAVRIDPDYPEARYNLGVALERMGRVTEAIEQYEQIVRLKPDYAEAQRQLARLRESRNETTMPRNR